MSALDMVSLLGPMAVIAPMALWLLVIGPLVLYPIARWRAGREPYPDPQLGLKVALHYFKLLGFQTLLLGAAILVWAIIAKGGDKGSVYRLAFGFLLPGAIVYGVHSMLLKRTNDAVLLGVHRLFLGYNLFVTGILGFVALVFGFQALFAKGSSGDAGRLFLAGILVYGSAWATISWLFARLVGIVPPAAGASSGSPYVGPPHNIVPPAPMPPPGAGVSPFAPAPPAVPAVPASPGAPASPASPSTPGLPPLGDGAFPPIDPDRQR